MSDQKGVMFQFFEWNLEADGTLYERIAQDAQGLREKGVTAVWFPPPTKGQAGGLDTPSRFGPRAGSPRRILGSGRGVPPRQKAWPPPMP